jgi:hypothetical protein
VRARLGFLQLTERDSALDEQRAVANVAPAQPERFLRSQAGLCQDRHQHRITCPAGTPEGLHRYGRQRTDLAPRRTPDLADDPHRVAPDPFGLQRALQNAPQQIQRMQHRHAPGTSSDPLGCQRAIISGVSSASL